MPEQYPKIGILQGRLTPSLGRGTQFFPFDEWEDEFASAAAIGFSAIELLVKKNSYERNPLWSAVGREHVRDLKKTHNIETPSVHAFYDKGVSYAATMCELLEHAAELGAQSILVSFFHENVLATEDDIAHARAQLQEPLACAERLGICLGVEAEMEASALQRFIRSHESKALKVYYDIGNMVSMNVDVPAEIRFLRELICGVHVKDRRKDHGESVPLGIGDANFQEIFAAFADIGYDGHYILQGSRSMGKDDRELNREYYSFVKDFITCNPSTI